MPFDCHSSCEEFVPLQHFRSLGEEQHNHRGDGELIPIFMVDPPGLFDTLFFTSTNTVYIRERVSRFYAIGEAAIPAGRVIAGQGVQAQDQRQVNLERAVAELAAENKEPRAELVRLAGMMENIARELARDRGNSEAGMSGQASGSIQPTEPADDEKEDEESDSEGSEQPDDVPEETPAPSSTPRRSRIICVLV